MVQGRTRARFSTGTVGADVDVPPGRIVYTQWLNERGGIEADLTVTRLARPATSSSRRPPPDPRPGLAPPADTRRGAVYRGRRHLRHARSSASWARARARCCSGCLRGPVQHGLPVRHLAGARDRLCPRSGEPHHLVGELGWELYFPAEFAAHVFDRMVEAGREFGLVHAGYHAMMRAGREGLRHWGHDIGPEDTPLEAGLASASPGTSRAAFSGATGSCAPARRPRRPAASSSFSSWTMQSCSTTRSRCGPVGGSWVR